MYSPILSVILSLICSTQMFHQMRIHYIIYNLYTLDIIHPIYTMYNMYTLYTVETVLNTTCA